MGIVRSNSILCRAVSPVLMLGAVICQMVFYPVYKIEIMGLDMENQNIISVFLETPSNAASCAILCVLTPGCVWANFTSDTGKCTMSDSVCLRSVDHKEPALFAVVRNMVSIRKCWREYTKWKYNPWPDNLPKKWHISTATNRNDADVVSATWVLADQLIKKEIVMGKEIWQRNWGITT